MQLSQSMGKDGTGVGVRCTQKQSMVGLLVSLNGKGKSKGKSKEDQDLPVHGGKVSKKPWSSHIKKLRHCLGYPVLFPLYRCHSNSFISFHSFHSFTLPKIGLGKSLEHHKP